MECAVITTYRCNAKCGMCNTWRHPSKASEEFNPEILEKIPAGMKRPNITGGEPFLRKDIKDIVRILDKKTNRLEISTNGYFYDRIEAIAHSFPDITIRVSIEGFSELNDRLRGIKNGFDRTLRAILRLKKMGIKRIIFFIWRRGLWGSSEKPNFRRPSNETYFLLRTTSGTFYSAWRDINFSPKNKNERGAHNIWRWQLD